MENNCNYNLISNNNNDTINKYCISNCCIPCPVQNYFYKDNNIEHDFYIINILRNISSILSLIILVKYIIKIRNTNIKINKYKNNYKEINKLMLEKNLNIIIIFLSLSIFLFSGVSFFSLKNPKNIQCKDLITSSNQENNYLCSIQGGILVYSSFSVVIWIFILILNFHIYNVWNSYYIITNGYFNNIIIFSIPFLITFIILSTNNISYEFSNLCLVSIENIFNMFFYPLGSIIFSAFIILIISLTYVIYKYIYVNIDFYMYNSKDLYNYESKKLELSKIIGVFKNHWRYIIIGLLSVFTFTFYWIFYYKQINNFQNIFSNLLKCLETNKIDICIIDTKNKLPSYQLMIISEMLVSIVGIWLFLIFADINLSKIFKKISKKKTKKNNLLNMI